jgi:hypothetical protein
MNKKPMAEFCTFGLMIKTVWRIDDSEDVTDETGKNVSFLHLFDDNKIMLLKACPVMLSVFLLYSTTSHF